MQGGLEKVLKIASDVMRGGRGGCRPRELSTIAQTAAKLGPLLVDSAATARTATVFAELLLASLIEHAYELDGQGIANSLHALATLAKLEGAADIGLDKWAIQPAVQELSAAVAAAAPKLRPQELANTAWAMAALKHANAEALSAVAAAACVLLDTQSQRGPGAGAFTPQGLSMLVWSAAKLDMAADLPELFAAVEAKVTKSGAKGLSWYDAQSLANLLWAFSAASLCRPELTAAVCTAARSMLSQFGPISLATVAVAWANQRTLAAEGSLSADGNDGKEGQQSGGGGSARSSGGGGGSDAEASTAVVAFGDPLVARAAEIAEQLNQQELGLVAWAVMRGDLTACSGSSSAYSTNCFLAALLKAALAKCEDLHWRTLGHIELVARCHDHRPGCPCAAGESSNKRKRVAAAADGIPATAAADAASIDPKKAVVIGGNNVALDAALSHRYKQIETSMSADSDARNGSPATLFRDTMSTGPTNYLGPALLVGDDPDGHASSALSSAGFSSIAHWRRFVWEGSGGAGGIGSNSGGGVAGVHSWPNALPEGQKYAACAIRFSAAGVEAFAMILTAVATVLAPGGKVWIFGNDDEGCTITTVVSDNSVSPPHLLTGRIRSKTLLASIDADVRARTILTSPLTGRPVRTPRTLPQYYRRKLCKQRVPVWMAVHKHAAFGVAEQVCGRWELP